MKNGNKSQKTTFSMRIGYTAIALFSMTSCYGASLRKITGEAGSSSYDAAINYNFEGINYELFNVMHKTSTETIHGYKYFIDPVDFGSIVVDTETVSVLNATTITATTGTITNIDSSSIGTNQIAYDNGTKLIGSPNMTFDGSTFGATATFVLNGSWDGWLGANQAWTYISSTQLSITGDQTGKYQKGDKVKLTQTTAKYFYVTAVAAGVGVTTVTVMGGSDYTLANAAITLPYYSKMDSPQGFPGWFAYAISWTASGTAPAIVNGTLNGRFCINGRLVSVYYDFLAGSSTTFGTGEWRFSLPAASSAYASTPETWVGGWHAEDTGLAFYSGYHKIAAGSDGFSAAQGVTNGAPFAWGSTDKLSGSFSYEF